MWDSWRHEDKKLVNGHYGSQVCIGIAKIRALDFGRMTRSQNALGQTSSGNRPQLKVREVNQVGGYDALVSSLEGGFVEKDEKYSTEIV